MFFSKIASLTQEVVRRSKNTSEKVSMEERVAILDEYHRRLELSQYSLEASRRSCSPRWGWSWSMPSARWSSLRWTGSACVTSWWAAACTGLRRVRDQL